MSTTVPTAASVENAIVDLVGLSSLTSNVIESSLSGDADFRKKTYGSSDLYYITDDTANGILHGVLKIDADLRGLLDQFNELPPSLKQKELTPAATIVAETPIDNLRTDWADAVAQITQALDWRQQEIIFTVVDKIEDALMHAGAFHGKNHPGVAKVLNEMTACMTYLRECIGMAAEDSDVPADEQAEVERAALLIRVFAADPGTNAEDIVKLVTPFLAQDEPAKRAA